ncbi:MAG: hypothetical protein JWL59_2919 [Chthoniobacteraceae bacterium]|nr:hypothetical protein [Chthoniobacteraceae bacterium]
MDRMGNEVSSLEFEGESRVTRSADDYPKCAFLLASEGRGNHSHSAQGDKWQTVELLECSFCERNVRSWHDSKDKFTFTPKTKLWPNLFPSPHTTISNRPNNLPPVFRRPDFAPKSLTNQRNKNGIFFSSIRTLNFESGSRNRTFRVQSSNCAPGKELIRRLLKPSIVLSAHRPLSNILSFHAARLWVRFPQSPPLPELSNATIIANRAISHGPLKQPNLNRRWTS